MRLSVVNEEDGSVLALDVAGDTAVRDVLAMFEPGLVLWHEERELPAAATLAAVGDGALVVLRKTAGLDPKAQQIEAARQMLLSTPGMLARLATTNSELAAAATGDPGRFAALMEAERMRVSQAASGEDEMTPEGQRRIEEAIRRQAIAENIAQAMDEHPETYGDIHMLYVPATVNGAPLKAFVDCGAQATIMPLAAATRCGIAHLLDTRFSGMADGIGRLRILGRVHSVQLSLLHTAGAEPESSGPPLSLLVSVTVIEDGESGRTPEMLLGLDMLRRYRAVVDLGRDALVVNGAVVPFLPQSETPHHNSEQDHV